MPSDGLQPQARIVDGLIAADPEAESHRLDAMHSHSLAESSRLAGCDADRSRRALRRRFETLRNIHDPRRFRNVHFVLGLLGCGLAAASLVVLDWIELRRTLGGSLTSPAVLAATGAWLGGSWCAALARRENKTRLVKALAGAAALLAGLLAALYDLAALHRWLAAVPGIAVAVLIAGVVMAASTLIQRTEPVFLALARLRWRRAEARYRRATHDAREDAESAAAAMTAWLNLVRAHVAAGADFSDGLMTRCLAYAADLVIIDASFAVYSARLRPGSEAGERRAGGCS
jgi:hypothetical protein